MSDADPPRSVVRVGGVPFDMVTMREAVERIARMATTRSAPRYVCTGNLDHLVIAERDPEFRSLYERAALVLADGAPIVWLSQIAGQGAPSLPERVAGSDLFWELAEASARHGFTLFLLGGEPGAADRAAEAMVGRVPGVNLAGTFCPSHSRFETSREQVLIRRALERARPDVLLVGFGAPKQEKWIVEKALPMGIPVSIGLGGSFELAAGFKKRAPRWVGRIGLEWAFRMAQEPRRLAGRYLWDDLPLFARLLAGTLSARARADPNPEPPR